MNLRRFDTLFVRLFLLMWGTLVLSHLVAYLAVVPGPPPDAPTAGSRLDLQGLPTLPSLPPGNPFAPGEVRPAPPRPGAAPPEGRPPGPPHPPGGLSAGQLWLDYGLRMLVIALGAALGARWLSAPMRRLSGAAAQLGEQLGRREAPAPLEETHGTAEVRATARVFNRMAQRLREQFDSRGLHMAALSHDLRTPLTRLRLRLERLPPDIATAASADVHALDEMVAGTLAVLQEQRDGRPAAPLDVGALAQALVDDLADQDQPVGLDLPPAGTARALAHPAALRRVLDNLVGNALRHGGGARLAVRLADARVEVLVDDDGPGIAPAQIPQAFWPWVRLRSGQPATASGHGLGLAIARDLAERDGGELSLSNRPEGGLRARLSLPAA